MSAPSWPSRDATDQECADWFDALTISELKALWGMSEPGSVTFAPDLKITSEEAE